MTLGNFELGAWPDHPDGDVCGGGNAQVQTTQPAVAIRIRRGIHQHDLCLPGQRRVHSERGKRGNWCL